MARSVVLLSGGLDSATTAAIARAEGYRVFALSVDYGQRHRFELSAAEEVARALGARPAREPRITGRDRCTLCNIHLRLVAVSATRSSLGRR
jgi:7-cyano-7-deazaguanine synthase in queuosine biosynthesis